jgi:glutamate racemase
MDKRAIGVFDSGLGGLTVLKEIMRNLPSESVVYFGDSGRAPYGTKSSNTIKKFVFQDIRFLMTLDIKMIVMACNTASAHAYEEVRSNFDIPLVEVVRPGAAAGVRQTINNTIGVIGTEATIASGVYNKAIKNINDNIRIYTKACPLLVNLVEEGWWSNKIALMAVQEYLGDLKMKGIDTLILGCTHYPLLENVIGSVMGKHVKLVSSACEAANAVKKLINEKHLNTPEKTARYRYYTSDSVDKFLSLGNKIFKNKLEFAEKIDIEKY